MWHVYRAINLSKKEVYHGVSETPLERINRSHCAGGTKAIKHWSCEKDDIIWKIVSSHKSQEKTSEVAHEFEKNYHNFKGCKNIKTAGI